MSRVKIVPDYGLRFECPGCGDSHVIPIIFCADSTHALAGQTVDLAEVT